MDSILEHSVHEHTEAKKQIKRIIGQWIVGENSGYCFGFERPPEWENVIGLKDYQSAYSTKMENLDHFIYCYWWFFEW